MRIRRRPSLQPSSSLNPDPSLQPPPKEEGASGGLHPPDGDLPDPLLQTLPPQHSTLEVLKEEKIQVLDDSSSQQTLSYMHAQGSGRAGSAAEVPFGVGGLAWCNGESAVAVPRKRRGSRVAGEDDVVKAKPVSTSNNNIAPGNNNSNAAGGGGDLVVMGEEGKKKKRGSPTVLMEGSRCSRVNGRGWRCCQQTLVGYSLCEHHLGKGRLRSMSSVRGTKSGASSTTTKHKNVIDGASAAAKQEEEEQCLGANDHSYGGMINKGRKKKKIGTMKARSISTLLDETDHAAAAIISSLAVPVLEIDKGLV